MTRPTVSSVIALFLVTAGGLVASEVVQTRSLGLTATSVFDTPRPDPVAWDLKKPGKGEYIPASFPGAPPLVGHAVEHVMPLVLDDNACLDCHDQARKWDEPKLDKGENPPMTRSHYLDGGAAAEGELPRVDPARFFCNQCHVAPTDASPLVANTFDPPPDRKGRGRRR